MIRSASTPFVSAPSGEATPADLPWRQAGNARRLVFVLLALQLAALVVAVAVWTWSDLSETRAHPQVHVLAWEHLVWRGLALLLVGAASAAFAGRLVCGLRRQAEWQAQRKQAEEALRQSEQLKEAVLDSLPAHIAVLDGHGCILAVNEPWRRFAGENGQAGDATLNVGADYLAACRKAVEAGDSLALQALRGIREVIDHQRDEFVMEYPCHSPTRQRWFLMLVMRPAHGVNGAIVSHTDITERKGAEEALRTAKGALEEAASAKDQFIAKLSHELRTPLTPVVAALSALARDPQMPGHLRDDMQLIQRNIGLEVHLINDLLDVTRIVNGKLVLTRATVDVAEVLHDVARIVSSDLDARGQRLILSTPGEPYWVDADRARLDQVFWNLLKNAIKFSPHEAPISVEAMAAGGMVRVAVKDRGQGIDPADLPRLFRAFEQGAAGHSFGGLGLGLAICKGVVQMHGGTLAAASDGLGRGATFTVTLPLVAAPNATAGTPSAREPGPAARSLRILLVEDHADTAKMMARLLECEGHTVTHAATFSDGLRTALAGEFDVLMSDLGLPDGSGHDLMRQLIAAGKALRGIAVSGHGTPADIQNGLDAGFIEHVTKPVTFEALHRALLRVASGRPRSHQSRTHRQSGGPPLYGGEGHDL